MRVLVEPLGVGDVWHTRGLARALELLLERLGVEETQALQHLIVFGNVVGARL